MAARAESTNYYYFLRLGRNSSLQFMYTAISTTQRYCDFPQPHDTLLSRCQAIFALTVTVLLNFLQLKYQGKDESPFETRPKTTLLALVSLVLYFLSCDVKLRISGDDPNKYVHCLVRCTMTFFGPLSLASLSPIFFPESVCPLLFSLSILYSLFQLLQSQIKKSWEWLKSSIMDRLYHQPQQYGRRSLLSVQLPWLRQLAIRDEVHINDNVPV